MNRTSSLVIGLSLVIGWAVPSTSVEWHHPFYRDGGGYWRQRISVVVHNYADQAMVGQPTELKIGTGRNAATLTGIAAESVRVCTGQGDELLFAITDSAGRLQTKGPIAAGSTLIIPVECAARKSADYFVYFDNPLAGEVPDFLVSRVGLRNGDVEMGNATVPDDWQHDESDARHKNTWVEEDPQSGKHCLKTVVDEGSEPSWISTRQTEILIRGGARYVLKAWVRAKNVKGRAGWYVHVGNRNNQMMINPMLIAGEGTFGWKQVTAEFLTPVGADVADLGTVLRGTGTAWFDNATLTCLDPLKVRSDVGRAERLNAREFLGDSEWPAASDGRPSPEFRAVVRTNYLRPESSGKVLGSVDMTMINTRLRGRVDPESVQVFGDGKLIPSFPRGKLLLFPIQLPPRTVQNYYVYYSERAPAPVVVPVAPTSPTSFGVPKAVAPVPKAEAAPITPPRPAVPAVVETDRNLIRNPGFESGKTQPDLWITSGATPGVTFDVDDPQVPTLGRRSARLQVPASAPVQWRGWTQDVAVRPGRNYLVSAQVKCADILGGEVRVHVHRRKSDGQLSKQDPILSIGTPIQGTTGWTLASGIVSVPSDTSVLQIHLTTDRPGTLWHDDVLVAEVLTAPVLALQQRPASLTPTPTPAPARAAATATATVDPVRVWQVPAIVKVFPDDFPPAKALPVKVTLARNERECLQLAVRAPKAFRGVRVEVDPPTGPKIARAEDEPLSRIKPAPLSNVRVAVVGYVPIDHPTSYFRAEGPAWYRKYPRGPGESDGWAGLWPDPLLPRDRFDLAADATQAVWISMEATADTLPGEYPGTVRLIGEDGQRLIEIPLAVHVWNYTLPERGSLKAIYDIGLGPGGARLWNESELKAYRELAPLMARNRICPNRILPDPTFNYRDGLATADFREFDAAAREYFDEWKIPHAYMPWTFYLFGWGFPPNDFMGEHPYEGTPPYANVDRAKLRPAYKQAYQACLRLFWDHVKRMGWQDRFVLYISDEPFYQEAPIRTQMKALCAMIHELDPKIPIYSSTWHHVPEWEGSLDIWGIGHYGLVSPEIIARLRSSGARVWFTTDGQMCIDTPYCAVERLLPYYCARYDVEAYEFWGVSWLTYDPFRFAWHSYIQQSDTPGKFYWVRYPNGDGFLLYPGAPIGASEPVSSIRFEQAREGLEDYEALKILRGLAVNPKLSKRDSAMAATVLKDAENLVPIPNAGGRYSSQVLPDPEAVDRVRESVAKAIEALSRLQPKSAVGSP